MSEPQEPIDPQSVDDEMERRRTDYTEMGQATGSGGERDLRDFHSERPPTEHDLHPDVPVGMQGDLHGVGSGPPFPSDKEAVDPTAGNVPLTEEELEARLDDAAQKFSTEGISDSFGDTAGFKFDAGKLRYDLIPMEAMKALATILTLGAKKYADRNWEGGMSWQRVYASLMRHLVAYESGEDIDPESGELHMAHALCNVVFLVTYQMRPSLADFDDRPKRATEDTLKQVNAYDAGFRSERSRHHNNRNDDPRMGY